MSRIERAFLRAENFASRAKPSAAPFREAATQTGPETGLSAAEVILATAMIKTPAHRPAGTRYRVSRLGSALDIHSPKSCLSLVCESLSMYNMWPDW